MRNCKLLGYVSVVLLIITSIMANCSSSLASTGKTIKVKLGVGDPIHSSVGVTAQHFAKEVDKATEGKVKVEVFADGVLFGGDQNAAVNMVQDGSMDATILSTSVYASFEKRMNAISLPYLFKNYDEFMNFLEGSPGQELLVSLDRLNSVGLALMIRTFRNVTNSVRPIETPADFQGLKLRVPNNRLWVEFFGSLGADPTPMDFKEVYTALQLKTIDGQENPVEVPLANRFYEVQRFLSMTEHIADAYVLVFNKTLWSSLDSNVQNAIRAAAVETARFKLDYDLPAEKDIVAKLESHGMQVNWLTADQKFAFQEIALALYPRFEGLVGADFMDRTLKFLGRQ